MSNIILLLWILLLKTNHRIPWFPKSISYLSINLLLRRKWENLKLSSRKCISILCNNCAVIVSMNYCKHLNKQTALILRISRRAAFFWKWGLNNSKDGALLFLFTKCITLCNVMFSPSNKIILFIILIGLHVKNVHKISGLFCFFLVRSICQHYKEKNYFGKLLLDFSFNLYCHRGRVQFC